MKLRIQNRELTDREELRALFIDAKDELAGSGSGVLESKLPWDGHPILLVDAGLHPVLVSFDPEQGQSALLNGLLAAEQLSAALPWVNQVYDALQGQQRSPKLLIVSKEFPPGTESILANCSQLCLFRFKVLHVNGETGLWLERAGCGAAPPVNEAPGHYPEITPVQPKAKAPVANKLPSLSNEEASYFQQL